MTDRLRETFQGTTSGEWANGKTGWMRYDYAKKWYQFAGKHYEGTTPYKDHDDIGISSDFENFPIIAKGITAYILKRMERAPGVKIYTDYYEACLSKFIDIEKLKPDAFKRDLDSEFYSIHLNDEHENIDKSEVVFSYITQEESALISEYVKNYFEYIEKEYGIQPTVKPDYSELFSALSGYILGIKAVEFTNIIEHKSRITGTPKGIWIKAKSEARYFANYIEMDIPSFNKCFSFADGTELTHHDKPTTKKPFKNTLAKYLPK